MAITTAPQLRAGRVMAGLSQGDLARLAGVSVPTVQRAEVDGGTPVSGAKISAIRRALEISGVGFTVHGGVHPRRPRPSSAVPSKPDGLKAPGLQLRRRANGQVVAYWIAGGPAGRLAIAWGYTPKTARLWNGATPPTAAEWQHMAERCRRLQREMLEWQGLGHSMNGGRGKRARESAP